MGWSVPLGQWFVLGFSIPSMFLYILLIFRIFQRRKSQKIFRSAFFKLVFSQFLNDLIFFLYIQFGLRFPRYWILPFYGDLAATLSYGLLLVTRSVLYLGQIPFALNRLCLFAWPVSYRKIWTGKTVLLCFFLGWFFPLAVNVPFFLTSANATMINQTTILFLAGNTAALKINTFSAFGFVLISVLICFFCFVISFQLSKNIEVASKMERRLLWFTIIQALPMLLEFLRTLLQFLFVVVLHVPGAIGVTSETLFYYMDITCTLPPYCLLATNANIRRLLLPRRYAIEAQTVTVMETARLPIASKLN